MIYLNPTHLNLENNLSCIGDKVFFTEGYTVSISDTNTLIAFSELETEITSTYWIDSKELNNVFKIAKKNKETILFRDDHIMYGDTIIDTITLEENPPSWDTLRGMETDNKIGVSVKDMEKLIKLAKYNKQSYIVFQPDTLSLTGKSSVPVGFYFQDIPVHGCFMSVIIK